MTTTDPIVGPIDSQENRPVYFPFSKAIGTRTISTVEFEVLLVSGEDSNPIGMISGSPTIDNTNKIVAQNFAPANRASNTYNVRCLATMNDGTVFVSAALMSVVTLAIA